MRNYHNLVFTFLTIHDFIPHTMTTTQLLTKLNNITATYAAEANAVTHAAAVTAMEEIKTEIAASEEDDKIKSVHVGTVDNAIQGLRTLENVRLTGSDESEEKEYSSEDYYESSSSY